MSCLYFCKCWAGRDHGNERMDETAIQLRPDQELNPVPSAAVVGSPARYQGSGMEKKEREDEVEWKRGIFEGLK